jgi:hypothetical protein
MATIKRLYNDAVTVAGDVGTAPISVLTPAPPAR